MRLDDKLGAQADAFYAALLQAHHGLSAAESHALNARLVLMLANEVGALERLTDILTEARRLSEPAD